MNISKSAVVATFQLKYQKSLWLEEWFCASDNFLDYLYCAFFRLLEENGKISVVENGFLFLNK